MQIRNKDRKELRWSDCLSPIHSTRIMVPGCIRSDQLLRCSIKPMRAFRKPLCTNLDYSCFVISPTNVQKCRSKLNVTPVSSFSQFHSLQNCALWIGPKV